MTPLPPIQEDTLKAFVMALSQQTEPLPAVLQAQLKAIGLNLPNRVIELEAIAASLPSLKRAYDAAMAELRAIAAQRGKGVPPAPFTPADHKQNTELSNSAVQIFTDPDPVQAAQKITKAASQGKNLFQRLLRRD
jgi:hypothetical protein